MKDSHGSKLQCEFVQREFIRLLDDDIEADLAGQLEAHLETCSHCENEWNAYRSAVTLLNSLDLLEAPDGLIQKIRSRLDRPSVLERFARWIMPVPQRLSTPILATVSLLLITTLVWIWSPWSPSPQKGPHLASEQIVTPVVPADALQVASWNDSSSARILPGAEEIMRPFEALQEDQERELTHGAALHDDLVLDITGSEEVFDKIQAILQETKGRMFLMGIRHRDSGRVVQSRMVLQIPFEHYNRLMERLESIGKVQHLFLDRDTVPLPPDRLKIRILAVGPSLDSQSPIQEVSKD
jgi:hypothetical protein